MKSLTESLKQAIMESGIKDTKLSGVRFVEFEYSTSYSKEKDSIKCGGWHKTVFNHDYNRMGKYVREVVAYWSPKCDYIFYYYTDEQLWTAMVPAECVRLTPAAFANFDDFILQGGVDIPCFDKLKTDLDDTAKVGKRDGFGEGEHYKVKLGPRGQNGEASRDAAILRTLTFTL